MMRHGWIARPHRRAAHWLVVAELARTARTGGGGGRQRMGDSLSALATAFTSIWTLWGCIALIVLVSVTNVRPGLAQIHHPGGATSQWRTNLRIYQLTWWGALLSDATDDERERLLRSYAEVEGYQMCGAGVGGIAAAIVLAIFALVTRWMIAPTSQVAGILLYLDTPLCVFYVGYIIGALLGYRIGVARIGQEPQREPPAEAHKLRDYCATWTWLSPIVVILATIGSSLYLAAITGARNFVSQFFAAPNVILILALTALACQSLFAHLIALSPNPAMTDNPLTSQSASDCYKANTIGELVSQGWLICAPIMTGTSVYWMNYSFPQSGDRAATLVLWLALVSAVMSVMCIFFLAGSRLGRIGGHLTGWWWQRRPAPRADGAAGYIE